jgi:hypothetical protein
VAGPWIIVDFSSSTLKTVIAGIGATVNHKEREEYKHL